jgi:putative transposase
VELVKIFKGRYGLHSQTIQALAQKLEANVATAGKLRKKDANAHYPCHPKQHQTVVWKEAAIHWTEDGRLLLSNGRNAPALSLPVPGEYRSADLRIVELTWRADHYELYLTLDTGIENPPSKESGQTAGVDLGEVNIAAVATEAGDTLVVSGRALRSAKQLRNKRHAVLTALLSRCQPGSKRQRKLMRSKARASAKLHCQQRDLLHKASRQVVKFCQAKDVKVIAIGDVRDVQDRVDLGKTTNQKISQWAHGRFLRYVSYKAQQYGMQVEQIPEHYSTRTCSVCGSVKEDAPRGRVSTCPGCGAVIHRDVNGACNICSRARYGSYGCVQAQTVMYLRPLRRSRAFDTGQRCLELAPRTPRP